MKSVGLGNAALGILLQEVWSFTWFRNQDSCYLVISMIDEHPLADICTQVRNALKDIDPGDSIWDSGDAVVSVLALRPDEVVTLAHTMLHAWPYRDVPDCWRRAFEEGSLWVVLKALEKPIGENEVCQGSKGKKRSRDGSLILPNHCHGDRSGPFADH